MQCLTGVWCLALLLVSALGTSADEEDVREKQVKIGVNKEEQFPISDHEYPRENVPTRPDYRGPGHWATPAPDSGIELGFIPIKTYAQVRRSISVKHLPRSDALASATTPEEKRNAPRLREVVTTKKISEVYTEEGYEDSAYDHGGFEKEHEKEEDYVKPAASNHQDSLAQGTNAVPKPGLPPGTWERHKVIRNETRTMYLGDQNGKDTIPMKVVASYSHTIQHPDGKGDVIESGSINIPSKGRSSANRRSSKVPRSPQHFTENLALPLGQYDASMMENQHMLVRNRQSEVSHPTMVQNYPAVIMQHNSEESSQQLLLRNQPSMVDYSSIMQQPGLIQRPASVASNTEPLFDTQNLPLMLMTNDPLQQAASQHPHQLNQNLPLAFLQNNHQIQPNVRTPSVAEAPLMLLPSNSAQTQNLRYSQQFTDNSQLGFLPQARTRSLNNRGKTRLVLVQDNPPNQPSNQPRGAEISLHYQTPPVIIEQDTPSAPGLRFLHPTQQRYQVHHRNLIANTKDSFLTPPPQYHLTPRQLVAFAKSNKSALKSQGTSPNEISGSAKSEKHNLESQGNATNEEEKEDHTTERQIITNGHLPWGVIANEGRKIPVSKLIPLKELSDDDEDSESTSNSSPSSITKIIKPAKVEAPKSTTQKTTKLVASPQKIKTQKTKKHMQVSDPRKNDTYSNELPHLAKFVEALTLAHYAPSNEHTRGLGFKSSGRKQNAVMYTNRNRDLQDMLAQVYVNKQKSIQGRTRTAPIEAGFNDYRRTTARHSGANIQHLPLQVEHRLHPGNANNDEHFHKRAGNTNVAVNRAPRISRKADADFQTKDINYLTGEEEEARLEEQERLLEEEKDKELEENVAQWKQAILEVDNPKPEIDTKKYPFYYAPVTKSIAPYSPLRYATNPKDIPKKTEGGMEFYESREKVHCPEVSVKLDIVPKKTSSGEWNKSPRAKLPRLRGLGDKIDCLKTKYFGEEPLDNPFFKETTVGLPKSARNRRVERVSEGEDEIESDPLGLYEDILKHVKSIGNPGNFPLYSPSSLKSVKPKQKNNQAFASSNRTPQSDTSHSSGTENVSSQNTEERPLNKTHPDTHRKPKNKKLVGDGVPNAKVNRESYSVRSKRPLNVSHKENQPHKQHPPVPKEHSEHSKRIKEDTKTKQKEHSNIQYQSGFRPLALNPAHYSGNPAQQHHKVRPRLRPNSSPIERPHGMHYRVSPHPYKIVSPDENGGNDDDVRASQDYKHIVGMQPPPVQKHRVAMKIVHRPPKEYPTSITELLPGNPKSHSVSSQRTPLKRIKEAPELSPPPLQYRLSPDGRVILAGGILSTDGNAAVHGLATPQQQYFDEMIASESAIHNVFGHPTVQVRTKRSSEFSEEMIPSLPLGVNDAAPLLQRRQDHVVVDRLGNMYYGHVNGDDAYWTTTENDIDANKQNAYTETVFREGNRNATININGDRPGQPRFKTHDDEYKRFNNEENSNTNKTPNYSSVISLSSGESRFSLSNARQNYNAAALSESKQGQLNQGNGSVRSHSYGNQEAANTKKALPITEAQSAPEVLSPDQINRILNGIMSRHSYSSRYRSEGSEENTNTTTTTTTEKPTTTSPRHTTKPSRRRPAKKHRVIPILSGRVIPELVTSTTKSPDIKQLRRRLPLARTEATTSATTESVNKGRVRHQKQEISRRGKNSRRESSTVSANVQIPETPRRRAYSNREHTSERKLKAKTDDKATTNDTKRTRNVTTSQSGSVGNNRHRRPQTTSSPRTASIEPTSEPDSTTTPLQRVQAIETRRVTKEEIFTTRYYPQHEEQETGEDSELRNSKDNKHEDEDDDKEIYEPYASQNFHSGNLRNALQNDHWNGKSKVINKKSASLDDEVDVQNPVKYFLGMSYEQETETVESPEDTEHDKEDAASSSYTVFPQGREEFKDMTVLTYIVDPNTGIGKWIPGREDTGETSSKRNLGKTGDKTRDYPVPRSDTEIDHDEEEEIEPNVNYSRVDDSQELRLSSMEDDDSTHKSNLEPIERNNHHDISSDEVIGYNSEGENRNHEEIKKEKSTKQQKVLQKISKDKFVSNEEHEDNSPLQNDKTATDLYVLVSLLPSSDETNQHSVKYVKHPGQRKYYYVQDYTNDDSENES